MANDQSALGQLTRSGTQSQRLITARRKKLKLKISHESFRKRIRESHHRVSFAEGRDENQSAKGTQKALKGRVYLVTIIEEGLGNSKDKNFYSAQALQSGVRVFEGAKSFADHPTAIEEKTLPERSMRELVGWYSDCFVDKNPETGKVRLRGKLHFFPAAKWLTEMIDTILTEPTAKGLFGISINAVGKTRPAQMDGEEVNFVEEFQRVDSADVVTEPAARGKFDQMLESRRSVASRKVINSRSKRTREAANLSSEKLSEIADSLESAYNTENPEEQHEAIFEAARNIRGSLGVTGNDPNDDSEQQEADENLGGSDDMGNLNKRMKTSLGKRTSLRKAKPALRTGVRRTGESGLNPRERERISEADVDEENNEDDLGTLDGVSSAEDSDDFPGSRKTLQAAGRNSLRRPQARQRVQQTEEGLEDEGMEGLEGLEDEGFEDGMGGGAPPPTGGMGGGNAAPMGGGGPGSSTSTEAFEDGSDGEGDDVESDGLDNDLDFDDERDGMDDDVDQQEEAMGNVRPGVVAEARNRGNRGQNRGQQMRGRMVGREADSGGSFSGFGKAGHKALTPQSDSTLGYGDDTDVEDNNDSEGDNGGAGLSYKIKTSRFARNKQQKNFIAPVVREANRRIGELSNQVMRLRESKRASDRQADRLSGIIRYTQSRSRAVGLLREAVKQDILPARLAVEIAPRLFGLNRKDQIQEIKISARFLEAAQGTRNSSRLQESVEGSGARGGDVFYGTSEAANSELVSGLAESGIPMREQE